ncbi:12989_t:CDS:2, partial [Funneliformis geosporum]
DHVDQQSRNLIDRIRQIIEKLPGIREKAKQTIIAPKSFDIGQKVLYYNAAKMNQFSGKLEPKWKGPYRIHEVLINGSYKIREIDGRLLARP